MPKNAIAVGGKNLTLDARPDRLDLRDLPYRPPVASLDPVFPDDEQVDQLFPSYSQAKLILDQGREGACTGFGLAAVINYLLWVRADGKFFTDDRVSQRMLYHLARFYDEWPGEDYEGSSCRGALKGWHRHGVCLEANWPYRNENGEVVFMRPRDGWDIDALSRPLGVYYRIDRTSVVDMQAAIYQIGAIYVSAKVHNGWGVKTVSGSLSHAKLPIIKPGGEIAGGHAFALVGYNDIGFVVQNSWGEDWGASGFAVLTYEDWVLNGSDAWAVALGVPLRAPSGKQGKPRMNMAGSRVYFVRDGSQAVVGGGLGKLGRNAGRSKAWAEQDAYMHTIVTGNDGYIINRLPHVADERDNAKLVVFEQPREFFETMEEGKPRRLVIYAHGGLNSEADSIARIRMLGPCFEENGVYPIFTTWKSGWLETIGDMIADQWKGLFGTEAPPAKGIGEAISEATDRTLEVFLRNVMVKAMWSEMKENVVGGTMPGRGIDELAEQLAALKAQTKKLEIHLIGHSAGSFVCGKLLSELGARGLGAASCTLYAPACSVDFALSHFKPALECQDLDKKLHRDRFYLHLLSDTNELDDSVGPYRKSLLYLVSRALEKYHKTPILGLVTAFDASRCSEEYWHSGTLANVAAWQRVFWSGAPPSGFADTGKLNAGGNLESHNLFLLSASQVNTGPRKIKSAHGCFDNSIDVVGETIKRIIGGPLIWRIQNLDY